MKIILYKILSAITTDRLEEQVNSFLKKGWEPFGEIVINVQKTESYMQTIIKSEKRILNYEAKKKEKTSR
jgi:hypothetical protein